MKQKIVRPIFMMTGAALSYKYYKQKNNFAFAEQKKHMLFSFGSSNHGQLGLG
jgi:hypothetical protein